MEHPPQSCPPVPHSVSFCAATATHCPPAVQHPDGQLEASQTQTPPLHRWPVAQARPEPQEHSPAALQLSAVTPHGAHACPVGPQASRSRLVHVLPTQQPWHVVAHEPHAPFTQGSPEGHAEHAAPRAPQAVVAVPATHSVPLQQPLGHVSGEHAAPPSDEPPLCPPPAPLPATPPPVLPVPPAVAPPPVATPPPVEAVPPARTLPPPEPPPLPEVEHEARQRPSLQH